MIKGFSFSLSSSYFYFLESIKIYTARYYLHNIQVYLVSNANFPSGIYSLFNKRVKVRWLEHRKQNQRRRGLVLHWDNEHILHFDKVVWKQSGLCVYKLINSCIQSQDFYLDSRQKVDISTIHCGNKSGLFLVCHRWSGEGHPGDEPRNGKPTVECHSTCISNFTIPQAVGSLVCYSRNHNFSGLFTVSSFRKSNWGFGCFSFS